MLSFENWKKKKTDDMEKKERLEYERYRRQHYQVKTDEELAKKYDAKGYTLCPSCDGEGKVDGRRVQGFGGSTVEREECGECDGDGWIKKEVAAALEQLRAARKKNR